MSSQVSFSVFTMCNQHHYHILEYFHHSPKESPYLLAVPPSGNHCPASRRSGLASFWFCTWVASPGRFCHGVFQVRVYSLFQYVIPKYSDVRCATLFICSLFIWSGNRYLELRTLGAVVNKMAVTPLQDYHYDDVTEGFLYLPILFQALVLRLEEKMLLCTVNNVGF